MARELDRWDRGVRTAAALALGTMSFTSLAANIYFAIAHSEQFTHVVLGLISLAGGIVSVTAFRRARRVGLG